ncbi:hypothetical protein COT75_00620 [Candidatus Beckwithbacteria bacterium CG10_big_fil_rev_8_21_14_0_10_34_10]|uniref:Class I SAM-dependent methyltransferase n=1 Tax=Candidatus Beckwithbacteria bacterium CG10_big_fil_rev_8_21_14_0_10_34_10 TaxID=1974495 RepID=A0A2H0WAU5_9BACT|nr:MAG: hypothetical protein COT75_00620 [Candidatus Beckwithbacteria bacterium CG10_big_fil_rev_8_21_14_0_10_34_10]
MICSHKLKTKVAQYGKTSLFQCCSCNLIYSNKYKKKFDPRLLYRNYYKTESQGRFKFFLEDIIKIFRFFRAFKIFTIYPRAKSILDIGCGRGQMLYYLKKYYHYGTVGTQLDQRALDYARKKLGLKIFNKDLLKIGFKKKSFDVVSLWHVLEHIKTPQHYLKKINFLLNKNGFLVIEVPNFNSWTSYISKGYWLGLDLDYHLNFFTPSSLSKIISNNGFNIKRIHTFSLEYSTFISVQSLVSRITRTDQLVFNWLQDKKFQPAIVFHLFLFILLTPICFFINLFLYFSKKGEVLLLIACKK